MTRFFASAVVLLAIPMSFLNPLGRPAFVGYYVGVVTMALTCAIAQRGYSDHRQSNTP